MENLRIHLFGKLWIEYNGQVLKGFDSRKVQELFCYLLLNRKREHSREVLADLLWCENTTAQSKSYLRKVLWQLQSALESQTNLPAHNILLVDSDWIRVNEHADMWLDVEIFEQAYASNMGLPGERLDYPQAQTLRNAIKLYQADLLEDCYQSWCLYERQRIQHMYLSMLDKLMGYSEAHQEYEAGIGYGMQILHFDRARESTHRGLMRLLFLSGDRTGALRQFERCVAALHEELGVNPTEHTTVLCDQIRKNQLIEHTPKQGVTTGSLQLPEVLGRLKQLESFLFDIHHELQQDIRAIEWAMKKQVN